jgi:3-oxoacyl-[acyl-carrier-protein] synthase-3
MSFHQVEHVTIRGITACTPSSSELIKDIPLFNEQDSTKFSKNTGITSRRKSSHEICASDLCYSAANDLLGNLKWNKNEIDVLIFVSQTPDYILPSTSNLLQHRLGLSKECFCIDVNLGCSGYIHGMSLVSNLLQNNAFNKALLLVGDTITKFVSPKDKSIYALFGDAGTATALEYNTKSDSKMSFNCGSDGNGENAIKIHHGGSRHKFNFDSLNFRKDYHDNLNERRPIDLTMNGIDVFNFAINTVPDSIKKLLMRVGLEIEEIDYFILHQANLFMIETIRKKLKINPDKFLLSIKDFGNTNGASIPLTLCVNFPNNISNCDIVMSGFGVGLSWGTIHYNVKEEILTNLIEI